MGIFHNEIGQTLRDDKKTRQLHTYKTSFPFIRNFRFIFHFLLHANLKEKNLSSFLLESTKSTMISQAQEYTCTLRVYEKNNLLEKKTSYKNILVRCQEKQISTLESTFFFFSLSHALFLLTQMNLFFCSHKK